MNPIKATLVLTFLWAVPAQAQFTDAEAKKIEDAYQLCSPRIQSCVRPDKETGKLPVCNTEMDRDCKVVADKRQSLWQWRMQVREEDNAKKIKELLK